MCGCANGYTESWKIGSSGSRLIIFKHPSKLKSSLITQVGDLTVYASDYEDTAYQYHQYDLEVSVSLHDLSSTVAGYSNSEI